MSASRKKRPVCPSCGTTKVVTAVDGEFLACLECETGIDPHNCPDCGSENFFLEDDPSWDFVCDDCGTEFSGTDCATEFSGTEYLEDTVDEVRSGCDQREGLAQRPVDPSARANPDVMTDLDAQIRDLIEGFEQKLSALVWQSAVEKAVSALRGTAGVRAPSRPPRAKAAPGKAAAAKTDKRGSPRQIQKGVQRVLAYVKANPNTRSEDIRKALSISHTQTGDALRRLLKKKVIKSKGKRRSTAYSVA